MLKRYARAGLDLGAVFIGRAGGVLATLFFVPQYQVFLAPTEFGVVAIILSLQSLFLTFDLGLSTIVGTEIAGARDDVDLARARREWHHGEFIIMCFASAVAMLGAAWTLKDGSAPVGPIELSLAIVMIASLLLANIAQAGLIALQNYRLATFLLCLFTLLRGGVAVLLLATWRAEILSFLIGQTGISLLHAVVMRFILMRQLAARISGKSRFAFSRDAFQRLWSRSGPMIVYTLAGAGALQLDKTIVARFISLEAAGIYYLAAVYALTPIAILGGPLYQYFLPKVAAARGGDADLVGARFQFLTVAAVVAPTVVLIVYSDVWLAAWLPRSTARGLIRPVAAILIAGAAISATGYYPTARLLTQRHEKFLSMVGAALAILVLGGAATIAARSQSLELIASMYFLYYLAGCIALWVRIRPSGRMLWISYGLPLMLLLPASVVTCLTVRTGVPGLVGGLLAASLCALETAAIALIWWRRYGLAPPTSLEDAPCQPSR